MVQGNGESERRWFSRRVYAASFGRYEGTRPAEFPACDVLIGREDQRARLLNLLLASGRKGAFLVTGHRGSGKTTFVRYCLDMYRGSVLDRFLAANAGRAFFWDRLAYFGFGILMVFAGMLVGETLQELVQMQHRGLLDWLVIAVTSVLCFFPMLRALDHFGAAYGPEVKRMHFLKGDKECRRPRKPELTYGFRLLAVAAVFFLLAPLGWPALAVSQLVVLAAWLHLAVNTVSFNARWTPQDPACADPSYTLERADGGRGWQYKASRALSGGGVLVILASGFWANRMPHPPADVSANVERNWLLAGALLILGLYRRARDQRRLLREWPYAESRAEPPSAHDLRWFIGWIWPRAEPVDSLGRALAASAHWNGFLAAALALIMVLGVAREWRRPFKIADDWLPPALALSAAALLWVSGSIARRNRLRAAQAEEQAAPDPADQLARVKAAPFTLMPQPRLLLQLKALVFLVIGLELTFPVVFASPTMVAPAPQLVDTERPTSPFLLRHIVKPAAELQGQPRPRMLQKLATAPSQQRLFRSNADETLWVAGVAFLLLLLAFLEYEWIVRPYALQRDDEALHRSKWVDAEDEAGRGSYPLLASSRLNYRRYAEKTFYWSAYTAWLPVLLIPVNLGFDVLEYRQVIEAMLAGLSESYRRTFLHWSNPLIMARRCLAGLVLAWIALFAGERWFGHPLGPKKTSEVDQALSRVSPYFERFLEWRPLSVQDPLSVEGKLRGLMVHQLSGLETSPPRLGSLHLYQLLMVFIVYFAAVWISRVLPLSPYRTTYQRITDLHQSLSSRLREESRASRGASLQGFSLGKERMAGRESGPSDPRAVERAFLQVLADCQNPAIQLPFTSRHRISLPIPEVIFVFDELDKLGGSPQGMGDLVGGTRRENGVAGPVPDRNAAVEPSEHERVRLHSLQRLFAELKNILSSGDARFVFIGGRNLHDAWLADQSARQPQLTTIFDAEIHLHSLLTDDVTDPEGGYLRTLRRFVNAHHQRAHYLFASRQQRKSAPWLWLSVEERWPAAFLEREAEPPRAVAGAQGAGAGSAYPPAGAPAASAQDANVPATGEAGSEESEFILRDCHDGGEWQFDKTFQASFLDFLAYKSRGNVKKINSLLESFLRPAGRYVASSKLLRHEFNCDHVLAFGDGDRFRIEQISHVVHELRPVIEEHLRHGDDKLAPGVFYLADSLLKFHRRAFTWANLGRIDELEHIHRSPDVRRVLEQIVLRWSESLLHLINNGMYDYRFESEFARELELLSRESEYELAAFNFTLDEAEALKSTYRARLERLADHPAIDVLVGLGELCEFDEEFETARSYFRRGIRALDEEFVRQAGQGEVPLTLEVLRRSRRGLDAARRVATWGVARVRLMLQIGMTFERAHDFEHGNSEYRDARTLSAALVRALLGWESGAERLGGREWKEGMEDRVDDAGGYLWTLKSLPILMHPVFAEAWLAEKSVAGVDTGPSLLEGELWELRMRLPFVSHGFEEQFDRVDPVAVQHSNFALTFAELHNKAGSLYFFKGRQLVSCERAILRRENGPEAMQGSEGYLVKALTHYSVSLHEVRRYNAYRRHSSKYKLNDFTPPWPTIGSGNWPEFAHRVAAGNLANFAEAFLARVSLFGLLHDLDRQSSLPLQPAAPGELQKQLAVLCRGVADWLDGENPPPGWDKQVSECFPWIADGTEVDPWSLTHWLGDPVKREQWAQCHKLLTATRQHTDAQRLAHSLVFSLTSASLLAKAGYAAGAAQERLYVVQTIAQYVWWVALVSVLGRKTGAGAPPGCDKGATWAALAGNNQCVGGVAFFLAHVGNLAIATLNEIERQLKREPESGKTRLLPRLVTAGCSLALGLEACGADAAGFDKGGLKKLICGWLEASGCNGSKPTNLDLCKALDSALEHGYPIHNRLRGLKVLVDHAAITSLREASKGGTSTGAEGPTAPAAETATPVKSQAAKPAEMLSYLRELEHLEARYQSPLHFTPIQMGTTLAGAVIAGERQVLRPESDEAKALRAAASHMLERSQHMYTLQRRYYEEIGGLYYLYDDFNDRTIHYNHAIQMAGTELISWLLELLAAGGPSNESDSRQGGRGGPGVGPAPRPAPPPPHRR